MLGGMVAGGEEFASHPGRPANRDIAPPIKWIKFRGLLQIIFSTVSVIMTLTGGV